VGKVLRKRGIWTRARARVFAKELYDAKLLSEEGLRAVGVQNSPKETIRNNP